MTPLIIILVILFVLLDAVIIAAALQPSQFEISRSIDIQSTPAKVFTQVNDLQHWQAWSPWEGLDPAMKKTYEGPSGGVGASYAWAGNNKVGEGKMTITESMPDKRVQFRLEFLRPFKATNATEFIFTQEGRVTRVRWIMSGTNNFIAKLFGLFMNMDKMVGRDFEKGLTKLKQVCEG